MRMKIVAVHKKLSNFSSTSTRSTCEFGRNQCHSTNASRQPHITTAPDAALLQMTCGVLLDCMSIEVPTRYRLCRHDTVIVVETLDYFHLLLDSEQSHLCYPCISSVRHIQQALRLSNPVRAGNSSTDVHASLHRFQNRDLHAPAKEHVHAHAGGDHEYVLVLATTSPTHLT